MNLILCVTGAAAVGSVLRYLFASSTMAERNLP